jgi:hypothetical protein
MEKIFQVAVVLIVLWLGWVSIDQLPGPQPGPGPIKPALKLLAVIAAAWMCLRIVGLA